MIAGTWGKIWQQKLDVQTGFRTIAQQVNALEAAAAAAGPLLQSEAKRFPTDGPEIAAVPTGV